MICWICGAPATTGEHKIKKSLLVALHGPGPYFGDSALSHVKNGEIVNFQGPGSDRLKYAKSLCHTCNSSSTQPFDRAFDTFFAFILAEEEQVLKRRMIDFADVYGDEFPVGQLNLFKYFVKLLGCDLYEHGHHVPDDLLTLLGKEKFQTRLKISFAINEDKLLWHSASQRPVGIGSLETTVHNLKHKNEPKYRWDIYFSFLHVYFWYWLEPNGPFGATWIADSRYLYLGSYQPLDQEQRAEFLRKLREDEDSL